MACFYVYNNTSGEQSPDVQTLKEMNFGVHLNERGDINVVKASTISLIKEQLWDKGVMDRKLLRYDANFIDEYKAKLNDLDAEAKRIRSEKDCEHVTSIVHSTVYGREKNSLTEAEKWAEDFYTTNGTLFHKTSENYVRSGYIDSTSTLDEYFSFFEDMLKKAESIKGIDENERYRQIKSYLLNIISSTEGKDRFHNDLSLAIKDFFDSKELKGKYHTVETAIIGNKNSKHPFLGLIDLLAYDKDGNVNLIDLKTGTYGAISPLKLLSYYMLTQMYKTILDLNGAGGVKNSYIASFSWSEDGSFKFNKLIDIASEINFIIRNNLQSRVSQLIPVGVKPLTSSEIKEKQLKITSILKQIFNSEFLNKQDKEIFKKNIENRIKEGREFWSYSERANVRGTIVDNNIVLTLSNNKKTEPVSLDKFVETELESINSQKQTAFLNILMTIRSGSLEELRNTRMRNSDLQASFYNNLSKYINNTWQYYPCDLLESFGIIVMHDILNDVYDFIVLTNETHLLSLYSFINSNKSKVQLGLENNTIILDDLFSEAQRDKYKGYENLPMASKSNVLLLKALIAIGEMSDEFNRDKQSKIGNIKVVSYTDGTASFNIGSDNFITALKMVEAEAKNKDSKLELKENLSNVYTNLLKFLFEKFETLLEQEVKDAVLNVDVRFPNHWDTMNLRLKINELNKILTTIKLQFPTEFSSKVTERQYNTPILQTYGRVELLISALNLILSDHVNQTDKNAFTFADSLVAAILLLALGKIPKVAANGYMLTGFALSLDTSVSYASPDESNRRISFSIDTYFQTIRDEFIKESKEINDATINWLEYIRTHYIPGGVITDAILGKHGKYYRDLFLKDPSDRSKIDKNFRFINPYTNANELESYLVEYLKVILWHFNRKRMYDLSDDVKKLSYAELSSAEHAEEYKSYLKILNSDINYLNIPLRKAEGARGFVQDIGSLLTRRKEFGKFWESRLMALLQYINPNLLTQSQKELKKEKSELLLTYNLYRDSAEQRVSRLESSLPEDFEWNINFLCNDYLLSYITDTVQYKLLRLIDTQIGCLRMYELTTGLDVSKQVDAIIKRTKISIYNENLVEKEYEDLITLVGIGKQLGSLTKIALRPTLFLKEMVLGSFKNISSVIGDFFVNGNKITMEHLMLAAEIVWGEGFVTSKTDVLTDKRKLGSFGFVELINNMYGVTDRDMNVYSRRMSADRKGLFNVGQSSLYYNVTNPDWFLRMTIFIAKMIADGTLEAHKINPKTGLVEYHIEDDKRFSEFWKHRNDPSYNSKTFKEQKSLYIAIMKDFEFASTLTDKLLYYGLKNESGNALYSPLPMAYSVRERDSIKELIGLLFGFYDHEEKVIMQNEAWYQMFTQFLTYLPGEIQKYLAIGRETSIGTYQHLKDAVTGEYLYWQADAFGNIIKVTESELDKNRDYELVKEWTGNPVDGLLISLLKTGHDIFTETGRMRLKDNPTEWKHAILCLLNILLGSLFGWIIKMMITSGSGDKKEASKAGLVMLDLANMIGRDLSFITSVVLPIWDLDLAGSRYISDLYGKTLNAISDPESTILMLNYMSILKDTHLFDK